MLLRLESHTELVRLESHTELLRLECMLRLKHRLEPLAEHVLMCIYRGTLILTHTHTHTHTYTHTQCRRPSSTASM